VGGPFGDVGSFFLFAVTGLGFGDVPCRPPGFPFSVELVLWAGDVTAPRSVAAVRLRISARFSVGVRTISSWREGRDASVSSVAASAKGTSRAAKRSTVDGSGIERPVAASSGTGRQTPRKSRMRRNTAGIAGWAVALPST
jgi:hypothetical protein